MSVNDVVSGAPREMVLREFAKRLQNAMLERGWHQSELARQATKHMADGKFGRDNVSNYVRGKTMPSPIHLNALAKALGKKPDDLLPARAYASAQDSSPPLDVKDLGEGKAWLRVSQAVEWPVALKVLAILKGE